ncbi:phage tail tube protein [Croceicoccus sp. YJ47]|uniref:phage tail tube protein n=1 Tax=Croceicoccus sp. YJ47 TaxID=2798724 RepID=UPI00192046CD|nr:phage tail tube protein [Croceicoccus sp. YJ47]QQN73953.1 hypothetical protein JD971_14585 [Croceicoccus sp. YJ47]
MTDAVIGYGAQFHLSTNVTAANLAKVAEVIEIGLPDPQTADAEATHFESPGRQREYIPGLIDNGEITIGINWIPGSDTDALIKSAQEDDASRAMKIVIPTGTVDQEFSFLGIVKGFAKNVPMDDRMTATVTIRVAYAVTQAAAGA